VGYQDYLRVLGPAWDIEHARAVERRIPSLVWVRLSGYDAPGVYGGIDLDGSVWAAVEIDTFELDLQHPFCFIDGRSVVTVHYDASPTRRDAVIAAYPSWVRLDAASILIEAFRARLRAEDAARERAAQTAADAIALARLLHASVNLDEIGKAAERPILARLPSARAGRYHLGAICCGWEWAATDLDALDLVIRYHVPVDRVCAAPDVRLTEVFEDPMRLAGCSVWSDETAITGRCAHRFLDPPPRTLPRAAGELMLSVLRHPDDSGMSPHWSELRDVSEIVEVAPIVRSKQRSASGGCEVVIERLRIRRSNDQEFSHYRRRETWWALTPDGDAGEDVTFYRAEPATADASSNAARD
jgi:hypothetical protein